MLPLWKHKSFSWRYCISGGVNKTILKSLNWDKDIWVYNTEMSRFHLFQWMNIFSAHHHRNNHSIQRLKSIQAAKETLWIRSATRKVCRQCRFIKSYLFSLKAFNIIFYEEKEPIHTTNKEWQIQGFGRSPTINCHQVMKRKKNAFPVPHPTKKKLKWTNLEHFSVIPFISIAPTSVEQPWAKTKKMFANTTLSGPEQPWDKSRRKIEDWSAQRTKKVQAFDVKRVTCHGTVHCASR